MLIDGDLSYAGISLVTILSAGVGAFIGAYLKKKAENLATHEDLNNLVAQMEATTTATKAIEAKISNEVWNRQQHWGMKKEAVFSIMQALERSDEALLTYSTVCEADRKVSNPEEQRENKRLARFEFYECIDDFSRKRALALLVCEAPITDVLLTIRNIMRSGARRIGDGEGTYSDLDQELKPVFAKAYAAARREIGVIRRGEKGK